MNKIIISISLWEVIWSMWIWKWAPSLYETLKWYSDNWYKVIHFMSLIKKNKLSNEIYLNKDNIIKDNFEIYFLKNRLFYFFLKLSKIKYIWLLLFYPFALIFYYLEVKKYIKSSNLINEDITFYGHSSYCAIISYFLWKKFNKKNIWRYYWTFLTDSILTKKPFRYFVSYLDILWHKINNTKKIIADDWTNWNKVLDLLWYEKYLFIKNGFILKDEYINSFDNNNFNIIMSSRLAWWKRIDIAIKTINILKEKGLINNIKLHIFWDWPSMEELKNLTNNNLLQDIITFHWSIPWNKVLDYIYHCDIFLSTNDVSNLSNALYQAIFYWKSIIATATWNTEEYVINDYNWYTVKTPEELSNKIMELYNDSSKNKTFWENSLKLSKEKKLVSWEERMNNEINYINN